MLETVITLLQKASLPSHFWFHACATVAYLINRMPTPILHMHFPFELLFKSPPTLHHLRVFRCACYPSMTPYRNNKLDPKTTECIFLGYASQYKGYICFSLYTNMLIVCRHVIFDEHIFPGSKLSLSSSNSAALSSSHASAPVVHPNTFSHPLVILIPLPQVLTLLPS